MADLLHTKLSLELLRIVDLKDILSNCSYKKNQKKSELVETIMGYLQNNAEDIDAQQKATMCFKIKVYTQLLASNITNVANLTKFTGPEIRLKCLPFFVTLFNLLEPSPISTNIYRGTEQSNVFSIQLTPQQVVDLKKTNTDILVQLRFCLKDNSTSEQCDNFPLNLKIIVNGKLCDLPNPLPMKPGIPQKYLPGPVNITHKIKHSTQSSVIECKWKKEINKEYFISCFLVRKVNCSHLLEKLMLKKLVSKDCTAALIKEKMNDADSDISTTSLRVSLICPLGKMRMTIPCRATTCVHLQCFDAATFLEMNQMKQTFICPVCNKNASYENLVVDEYFQEVLASCSLGDDDDEIELKNDGSWNNICNKSVFFNLDSTPEAKPRPEIKVTCDQHKNEASAIIDLTDATPVRPNSLKRLNTMPSKTNATVDLTSSDSDDDTIVTKKSKRMRNPLNG